MMDSPNNCVCNYQFGALTPIWERPSHHPLLFAYHGYGSFDLELYKVVHYVYQKRF
ncbi:hypothetical protein [Pseudoalteromonas piscicida]|uniref:hypothetical protein n=1 Tax=Pseudoalteromonas piscicida TaxID=43662 RepID=UPI003C7DF997